MSDMLPIPDIEAMLMQYPSPKPRPLLVTAQMFADGYDELIDGVMYHRQFTPIYDYGDGTLIVHDPKGAEPNA